MEVVDHAPHEWFLLKEGPSYFLDVNCNVSAAGFSMLIELTDAERKEYQRLGRIFVQSLARQVQNEPNGYAPRNLHQTHAQGVSKAIATWRSRL